MTTARAVVEHDPKTMHMITFGEGENPRSMQLYGVDPVTMSEATKIIVGGGPADHIDMNFGCPHSTQ
jgi:tRNA-dihydrouridine synthase